MADNFVTCSKSAAAQAATLQANKPVDVSSDQHLVRGRRTVRDSRESAMGERPLVATQMHPLQLTTQTRTSRGTQEEATSFFDRPRSLSRAKPIDGFGSCANSHTGSDSHAESVERFGSRANSRAPVEDDDDDLDHRSSVLLLKQLRKKSCEFSTCLDG